jgi:hypothetical protein
VKKITINLKFGKMKKLIALCAIVALASCGEPANVDVQVSMTDSTCVDSSIVAIDTVAVDSVK